MMSQWCIHATLENLIARDAVVHHANPLGVNPRRSLLSWLRVDLICIVNTTPVYKVCMVYFSSSSPMSARDPNPQIFSLHLQTGLWMSTWGRHSDMFGHRGCWKDRQEVCFCHFAILPLFFNAKCCSSHPCCMLQRCFVLLSNSKMSAKNVSINMPACP